MPTTDPRVDAYIARAAPFAQAILMRLRADLHAGCPDAVETIKWSMPFFMHEGRNLAFMAGFKQHCGFGFWRGGPTSAGAKAARGNGEPDSGMGQFGKLASLADLPTSSAMKKLVRAAVQASRDAAASPRGAAAGKTAKKTTKPVVVPPALADALDRNAQAAETFAALSTTHRREYADWIAEAKGEDTRERRVRQAIEWLGEGKSRHWQHQRR